jgi:DNA-binding XRE family transcriptional regulator
MRDSSSRPSPLGYFLKERRRRIDPATTVVGARPRLPNRVGRRVTQEEIAEAIDVSRVWYALLESGKATGTSLRLLDRLAVAFGLSPSERVTLFSSATSGAPKLAA